MSFPSTPAEPDRLIEIVRSLTGPRNPLPTDAEPRLTRLPGVRAVLFDIYGTLLLSGSGDIGVAEAANSADALDAALDATELAGDYPAGRRGIQAYQQAIRVRHDRLREEGIETPEVDIREVWQTTLVALASQARAETCDDRARLEDLAMEYETRVNPTWPMPGLTETLADLRQRFPIGIISNAQCFTPLLFEAHLGESLDEIGFDPALRAYSFSHRSAKPGPEMFQAVLAELQQRSITPAECLYVGNDMLNDVFTADRAGLKTVLFAGDRRSLRLRADDPRCRNLQPSAVITDLRQLPELF
jgi:putative hydrolase of the HAD superfamily